MGPHPHALLLLDFARRNGRGRSLCAWGPTPMRWKTLASSVDSRLGEMAGGPTPIFPIFRMSSHLLILPLSDDREQHRVLYFYE